MMWRGVGASLVYEASLFHIARGNNDTTSTSHWLKWFRKFKNRFWGNLKTGFVFRGPGTVLVIITQFYQVRLFQASHWRISDQSKVQAQSSLSSPSSTRWDFSSHLIGGFLTNQRSRHSPRYHHPVLHGETFLAISLEDFWPITRLGQGTVLIYHLVLPGETMSGLLLVDFRPITSRAILLGYKMFRLTKSIYGTCLFGQKFVLYDPKNIVF